MTVLWKCLNWFCNNFRGKIDDETWRFLLTGGVALDNPHPNPYPQWLTDKSWSEIVRASNLNDLKGWMNGTVNNILFRFVLVCVSDLSPQWKEVYDSVNPQDAKYPEPWQFKLTGLSRMVVLRCIRPDKIVPAVQVSSDFYENSALVTCLN